MMTNRQLFMTFGHFGMHAHRPAHSHTRSPAAVRSDF